MWTQLSHGCFAHTNLAKQSQSTAERLERCFPVSARLLTKEE